jgi:hypothetical protein
MKHFYALWLEKVSVGNLAAFMYVVVSHSNSFLFNLRLK